MSRHQNTQDHPQGKLNNSWNPFSKKALYYQKPRNKKPHKKSDYQKKDISHYFALQFFLFFGFIAVYYLTSAGNTPYNYFTRLAAAFLKGQYWITDNPSWLSELIPAGNGKFFIVYPPMPAILAMPFVAIFGEQFPQQFIAHFLGAALSIITFRISFSIKKNVSLALWSSLLVGLGSVVWYLSATGSVWFIGNLTAAFLLSTAILESLNKKRLSLIGILIGAAYLSRPHTILSLPFFIYALKDKLKIPKNAILFMASMAPFAFFDFTYNFIRYGVPWSRGHFMIPGTADEPWFAKGTFHYSYIIEDIKVAFLMGPKILDKFPYLQPSWAGMAIWLTTPAFIFSLLAPLKKHINKFAWLAILPIFLVVGFHGGTGFAQFGYRFGVDFYAFLIFLTIQGVARTRLNKFHWILLIIGITVNLWGVLWINKFGWVSY